MFILDTNVVSELMRRAPHPAIVSWVAERPTSNVFLTAVTEAELRFGLAVMPPGKRRDGVRTGLERMMGTGFESGLCSTGFPPPRGASLRIPPRPSPPIP